MRLFITIPRTVEAAQVDETDFTGDHPNDNHVPGVYYVPQEQRAIVNTGYGQVACKAGDWILRDKGAFHTMTNEQFNKTYTPANSSPLDTALAEVARLTKLLEGRS